MVFLKDLLAWLHGLLDVMAYRLIFR